MAAVRQVLAEQGFQVKVVLDLNRARLYQAYTVFINRHGHDIENRLLFNFAGHGHTDKAAYRDDMGCIVPVDTPNPHRDLYRPETW